MNDEDTTASGGTDAQAAGERAARAFSVLGNETRLGILLALWDAYDPDTPENALSFSDLYRAVDYDTPGNFNYHLKKLLGRFVRKTDAGYELRRAGLKLVRAVIAGVGAEDVSLEPTDVGKPCPRCEAPTVITYEDEMVHLLCTECEGYYGHREDLPDGALTASELDPAGFVNRNPTEIYHASWVNAIHHLHSAIDGVCDQCSGPVVRRFDICEDHESDGLCSACGRGFDIVVQFRCRVCKNHHTTPPHGVVKRHPAVVSFLYDRGVPLQHTVTDFEALLREKDVATMFDHELASTDPPRVAVTVRHGDDEVRLTIDEGVNVVDVTGPSD